MAQTIPDLRKELFLAQEWLAELMANTGEEQLTLPTPCTDFDVRELIVHMLMVCDKVVGLGRHRRDPFAKFTEPLPDWVKAFESVIGIKVGQFTPVESAQFVRERSEQAQKTWTDDLLDSPVQLGWGPVEPGRVVIGLYLMETVAHGWDLARATGQPSEAAEAIAEPSLLAARLGLPAEPRGEVNGVPFGPVVPSAADAGLTEQLANWLGRESR